VPLLDMSDSLYDVSNRSNTTFITVTLVILRMMFTALDSQCVCLIQMLHDYCRFQTKLLITLTWLKLD
jgi:hypothetical protein